MILFCAYFILCCFLVVKSSFYKLQGTGKFTPLFIFILKMIAGMGVWYIYTYYYTNRDTSDTYRFFDDAMAVYKELPNNPAAYFKILTGINTNNADLEVYYQKMFNWYKENNYGVYNDNRTIIRLNMLFLLFSKGNFHIHTLLANLVSFTGLVLLFKALLPSFTGKIKLLLIAVFFIPDLLFWGSGVLKETILLFGLGLLFFYYLKLMEEFSLIRLLAVLLAFYIIFLSKFYFGVALLPSMVGWYFCKKRPAIITYAILTSNVIALVLLYFAPTFSSFHLPTVLTAKQHDFIVLCHKWSSGSLINIPLLDGSWNSLLYSAPVSLFTTYFRPFFIDAGKNPLMWLSSLENLFFVVVTIICFRNRKTKVKLDGLLLTLIVFAGIMATLIGWVTPVMGAIVRYKAPLMPFLYYLVFSLADKEKLLANKFLLYLNNQTNLLLK